MKLLKQNDKVNHPVGEKITKEATCLQGQGSQELFSRSSTTKKDSF